MRFFTILLLLGACATESTVTVATRPPSYGPVAVECTSARLTRPNDPAVLVNCPSTVIVEAPSARPIVVTARPTTVVVTQPRVTAPPATLQTHSTPTPSPSFSHPAMSSPAVVSHPTATTPTATASTPTVHHR